MVRFHSIPFFILCVLAGFFGAFSVACHPCVFLCPSSPCSFYLCSLVRLVGSCDSAVCSIFVGPRSLSMCVCVSFCLSFSMCLSVSFVLCPCGLGPWIGSVGILGRQCPSHRQSAGHFVFKSTAWWFFGDSIPLLSVSSFQVHISV